MKILVQQWNGIGDFILTLPSFKAIRKAFPKAYLALEVPHPVLPLAKHLGLANSTQKIGSYINNRHVYDYAIIFTYGSIRPQFGQRVKKTLEITFEDFPQAKCHMSLFLYKKLFKLLRKEKLIKKVPAFQWPLLELPAKALSKAKKENNIPILKIAIHPGAGFTYKCWPTKRFANTIRWLSKIKDCHLFILGGPGDKEIISSLQKELAHVKSNKQIHWLKNLSLFETAVFLKGCDLYLGNDSGVSHIAGALQIPTVCIFGPMGPGAWGPYGSHNVILFKGNDEINCQRCNYLTMPQCKHQRCLKNISCQEAKQAIGFQLGRLLDKMCYN